MPWEPIVTKSATQAAFEVLREAILAGKLRPGRAITAHELTQTGVGKTSAMSAIEVARTRKLVEGNANRPATVRIISPDELERIASAGRKTLRLPADQFFKHRDVLAQLRAQAGDLSDEFQAWICELIADQLELALLQNP